MDDDHTATRPLPKPVPDPRLGGHALVEALLAQGVHTCFGVPGESFLAVLDGLHEHRGRIRFVACRHEGGAGFMAEAQGKLGPLPGVCLVTRGPGASNVAIAVHTAFQDSTPLVVFVGQVAGDQRDREAFQELDYRQFFGPGTLGMAKWAAEVPSADRLPEYVARAFHVAQQGRPGPVVLALPEDVLSAVTAAPVLQRARPAEAWPAPGGLRTLRDELLRAQRPLLLVGGGGWTAASCAALQRFAEQWSLPVATAFRFQDLFDNDHPLYAGDLGIAPDPALAARVAGADLLVAVGPRLGEMTTGGYALPVAPRPAQRLVHVHPGAEELGRVYAADLLLQASLAVAGKALESIAAPPVPPPWAAADGAHSAAAAHAARQAWQVPPPLPAGAAVDLAEVVRTAQRLAPPDTVWCNGAGNFAGWLHRFLRHPGRALHGRTQLAPTSGAMGYGVPAAIAAALLHPARTAVAFAGDGDFLMTGQELATASAHGARRLVVVVVDNAAYGTIRMHQEREFPGRVSGTALRNPDFAALARAYGWAAERVETTAAFGPAFAAALERADRDGPTLLHVPTDVEVISPRTTLSALRDAARARAGAAR